MAEKYWTEGRDRGVNGSSTEPVPTDWKLSVNIKKNKQTKKEQIHQTPNIR